MADKKWSSFPLAETPVNGTDVVVGLQQRSTESDETNVQFTMDDIASYVLSQDSGAGGSVSGPVSSTDNALARFNGTGGITLQNSGVIVDDGDNVTGMASLTLTNTGLHLLDTNATHDLIVAPGSNLTADRTLTLTTGDANRTLTITADSSIGGTAYVTGGTDVALADGGTGASLADPNADRIMFWDDSAGAVTWLEVSTGLSITGTVLTATSSGATAGKHAMWIAAGSIAPSATGGCAPLATIASAANQPDIQTLDFDASTQEYAQFSIRMMKSWNEGTVTFAPVWSHAATTTNFGVVWDLQAYAASDDDAIATAFGTAQTSTDTGGTTNDVYTGPESSAITIAGTPAAEDYVFFRLSRVTGNGSDTMAIDARLHGITLYITTDAENDA